MAEIEKSGPFSNFAGYQRKMALLRGNGVALSFADGARRELLTPGDLVEFDGGMPTQCELLDGGCADLNLMVRSGIDVEVRVQAVTDDVRLSLAAGGTVLIFPIDGPIVAQGVGSEAFELAPWDLAMLAQAGAGTASASVALHSPEPNQVFLATMHA